MAKAKKIGIIGSGVAGLAIAVRLAAKGHRPVVFEKEETLGGKMGQLSREGYRFDTGPSLFTRPCLMNELTSLVEENEAFTYQKMDVSCQYFWEDGTAFTAYENKDALRKELNRVFPEDEKNFMERLQQAKELYDLVGNIFIEKPLNKWKTWLTKDVAKALARLPKFKLGSTMHEVNQAGFVNPKVRQLFDRFATYNGSNPFEAPALLNMIPHLELNLGTYYPDGGLRSIPQTLVRLGKKLGVEYRTAEAVTEIQVEDRKAVGITTSRDTYSFDAVVSNADVHPTYRYLLKDTTMPKRIEKQERSSSGIIFYWGVSKVFPQLSLHNIFFSECYEKEFRALFKNATMTDDPTIYLNISSKVDPSDAPEGSENWFILINAPANRDQNWDALIAEVRKNVICKLERMLGEPVAEFIEFEEVLDPRTIERKTSSYQGSLYGTSSNHRSAAFRRHTNDHNRIGNLYFCGGSVHPGGGIPLCLNSAKIVSNLI